MRLRPALLALALVALVSPHGLGQDDPLAGAPRRLILDTGLPAIDRGLRDQDPPRAPRGASPWASSVASAASAASSAGLRASDATAANPPYLRGSVIVKYASETNFRLVPIPVDLDPETASAALRARADVEYAQPRYVNHAMSKPNDPLYGNQWNFPALDMERAWDIQPGATPSIVVAVLDSGVAFRTGTFRYTSRFSFRLTPGGPVYPALGLVDVPFAAAPELVSDASRFVAPRDFIWDDTSPVDLDGHGTHVAGTVGQLTNNGIGVAGMAYNVRLMPVKVIQGLWDEIFSSPNHGTDDIVARGIRHAVDNGAKVINLSIGRTTGGPAPVVEDALRYAVAQGVFVAVAAGNTRAGGNQPNRLAQIAPSLDGMVAVGAVGRTLEAAFYSTSGSYVELVAPGGDQRQGGTNAGVLQQTLDLDMLETYDRPPSEFRAPRADAFAYYYFQGTSMATPHVSGFAALLMQQGITKPAAIEDAMKRFATDKGEVRRDDQYGYGLINPRATLRGLGLAR
jgi:serine protease